MHKITLTNEEAIVAINALIKYEAEKKYIMERDKENKTERRLAAAERIRNKIANSLNLWRQ